MRIEDMPFPGIIPNGQMLRKEAMKALNYVEIMADMQGGESDHAQPLQLFFQSLADILAAYVPSDGGGDGGDGGDN